MKKLILLMLIIVAMIACESPSSKRAKEELIRVVIIDESSHTINKSVYTYKVKLLDNSMAFMQSFYRYEADDTVKVRPSDLRR